jgi:hypothetical protein
MSSQCKGTTKSGTQCKVTIVLPNGYCRIHQDQYVVDKKEDTKEAKEEFIKVEDTAPENNIPKEQRENINIKVENSTSYISETNSSKRWYIIPIIVMGLFWVLSQLMKKKK